MKRTLQQNRVIHQLIGRRGLDIGEKASLVSEVSGGRTESSAQLTREEANKLIKRLGGEPISLSRRTQQLKRQEAGVKQIISHKQREYMFSIWNRFPHRHPSGLDKLCERTIKRQRPRTTEEANKVIEAIKAMNLRTLPPSFRTKKDLEATPKFK